MTRMYNAAHTRFTEINRIRVNSVFSLVHVHCNSAELPVEHLWGVLCNKLIHLLDIFVPFKLVGTNHKQPW